jgi:hypothetical protein
MKLGRGLVLVAIAVLGLGLFTATALAGKKKKTTVTYFAGSPSVSGNSRNVSAKGSLSTVQACRPSRGMTMFLTDASGNVLATLDGGTSDSNGNWKLQGQVPNTFPTGTYSIQVKANKRTAGKYVCKAGFSALGPITITK